MKVKMSRLVNLFLAAGFGQASKWDQEKLEDKVSKFNDLIDKDKISEIEDEDLQSLAKKLRKAEEITVIPDKGGKAKAESDEDEAPKKRGRPKGSKNKSEDDDKPKKRGRPKKTADDDDDEKPRKKKKGKEINRKKEGVIRYFENMLIKAGEAGKPISEKKIMAKLVEKFPDRDEDSMRVTFRSQVPTRFREQRSHKVEGSREDGWMIVKSGKKAKKARKDDDD